MFKKTLVQLFNELGLTTLFRSSIPWSYKSTQNKLKRKNKIELKKIQDRTLYSLQLQINQKIIKNINEKAYGLTLNPYLNGFSSLMLLVGSTFSHTFPLFFSMLLDFYFCSDNLLQTLLMNFF
jgi:hypothetical protein